jgi:hypothetical protein
MLKLPTLVFDEEILNRAPRDATHVDELLNWYKFTNNDKGFMTLDRNNDWNYCNPFTNLRLLADIQQIVLLQVIVQKQIREREIWT